MTRTGRKRGGLAAGAGAIAVLLAAAGATRAEQSRTEELEREVRRLRALGERYRTAERSVLGEVETLGREAALADRELALAAARLADGEAEAARLDLEERRLDQRVAADRAAVRQALLAAHSRRTPDWILAVLAGGSPGDASRTARMLGWLGERQAAAIGRLEAETRALARTRSEVEARNASLRTLRAEIESRRSNAARARERREDALRDLSRRRSEALAELERASGELRALVGEIRGGPAVAPSTGFADRRGSLPWPADGQVTKSFGVERHPRFQTLVEHPGLDLAAASGSPVRAVHAGSVAYADWFKGYGLLVIVDHGEGWYTLYAHLGALEVTRGARVSAGTFLGRAGDAGSLDAPGLYFEIRRGSDPVDPASWLGPRR